MELPIITDKEVVEFRPKLFEALAQYVQTVPSKDRNLSLTEMASITGETKLLVKSALESLQHSAAITIDRNKITLNRMVGI